VKRRGRSFPRDCFLSFMASFRYLVNFYGC
jgi:hypothetical protein